MRRAPRTTTRSDPDLRLIVDSVPELVSYSDAEGYYLFINHQYESWFGLDPKAIVGQHYRTVLGEETFQMIHEYVDRARAGERVHFETVYRFPCAGERAVSVDYIPSVERGQVRGFFSLIEDITERRVAIGELHDYQSRLRSLAARTSLIEERERQRIAAELHDRVIQNLGLSRVRLGELRTRLRDGSEEQKLAGELREVVEDSIQSMRSIVSELSPPVLHEIGFGAAIDWLAERFEEEEGIRCRAELSGDLGALGGDLRIILFQALRELLRNVAKHADAQAVAIDVSLSDERLKMRVTDDGVGFDLEAAAEHRAGRDGGFGIFSVRERIAMLGGETEVRSSDAGTTIAISVPMESTN